MRSSRLAVPVIVVGVALALGLVALAWALGSSPSQAQDDTMHNCPQSGKWSIATWDGADGTSTEQAVATCGEGSISTLYWLDPDSQGWKRYISGRPEVSNLTSLKDHQGVLALGSAAGPTPTATAMPTATATPTGSTTRDVTLVSSNAFTTTSSLLIDGESRRMYVVGELRNESTAPRKAGKITITVYDAAGSVVGRRWTYDGFDLIILPGRTTAFRETWPSPLYSSDETNDFPEGWTRFEVTLSPHDPYEWEELPVDVAVENVQITDGGRHVTGDAVNASSKTVRKYGVDVYVIYYRADGTVLNVKQNSTVNDQPLGPGESAAFDISFSSREPVDFSSYVVQAYAEPE